MTLRLCREPGLRLACGLLVLGLQVLGHPRPASAVMDIEDRGPLLNAGRFAFRPTNIGVLGNAFYDVGRSFDPSFEYPRGSGVELLKHADLWVGAKLAGQGRVSGGPLFEWRPTLDPTDRVSVAWRGQSGSRRGVDDDGDGKYDEERLDGKDNDGDGEVDEDIGIPSDQMAGSRYRDDQPEAVNYGYPNGEPHRPLGLDVYEEEYCSALRGYDGILGVQYTITNHGAEVLHDVYVGLLADLDLTRRDDPLGHLDDIVGSASKSVVLGRDLGLNRACPRRGRQSVPVITDGTPRNTLPAITVIGLGHTIDPLADFYETQRLARAPGYPSFTYSIFRQDLPPGQGGVPALDDERYAAMVGTYPENPSLQTPGDQVVLVRCGPFASLSPGQSLEFAVALCAAPTVDSLRTLINTATFVYDGFWQNRLPDSVGAEDAGCVTGDCIIGATGKNGHEVCLDVPAGISVSLDAECTECRVRPDGSVPPPFQVPYHHGQCVWTDADCDHFTTGVRGYETHVQWLDPGSVPPRPNYHVAPSDHGVTLAWDNQPEILLNAGIAGAGGFHFSGYRLYRLSDWRGRRSQLPPPERWEELTAFGNDSLNAMRPLAQATDTTVGFDLIRYGQKHYPIGRYRYVDDQVLNGFDYLYLVTTVATREIPGNGGVTLVEQIESPLAPVLDSVVVPHDRAADRAGEVWVVPNPYRGTAGWDRPSVPGDVFGRHVDFFGMPRAKATIRIYTLAGDLVAQVEHDGTHGDGQAPWNLITRNGQDVASGIYLFTVDSRLGHQVGRFVIMR
jgi:hypothetical protein